LYVYAGYEDCYLIQRMHDVSSNFDKQALKYCEDRNSVLSAESA
jgi:hypothetical protein